MRIVQCRHAVVWVGLTLGCILSGWQPLQAGIAEQDETAILSGVVQDAESGEPIVGVVLAVKDSPYGTTTDKDGYFRLDLKMQNEFSLQVTMLGYNSLERQIFLDGDSVVNLKLKSAPVEGSEVTVEDERDVVRESTQSITVLDEVQLQRTRGQTFSETLKEVPGVTVLQTGPSIAKPVIRGLHSDRIVIVNAGVQQEGQQWGSEHAPALDPFEAARIEVLRGAAGVQYGSKAIGGVIRVSPQEAPESGGVRGNLNLNGFSNNRHGASALSLQGTVPQIAGLGWRVQGSLRKAGDSSAPDYVLSNTGFAEQNGSVTLGLKRQDHRFTGYLSLFSTDLAIFRGSHIGNLSDLQRAIERGRPAFEREFTYEIDTPKQSIRHVLASLNYKWQIPTAGVLEVQYGWQKNNRQEFDSHRRFSSEPPTEAAFALELTSHSVESSFKHLPWKNIYGKFGVSAIRQGNVKQTTGYLIPNFRSYDVGAFLIERWSARKLTLEFGGRFDYRWIKAFPLIDRLFQERRHSYSNVSGVLGMIYAFDESFSFGINLGSGWRAPGVNELYSDGVHHGSAQFELGNADLQTEKSVTADLTLNYETDAAHAQLSFYRNQMNDYIYLFPEADPVLTIRGAFPAFSYQQTDARLTGFDGFAEYQFLSWYRLGVSGSLVRGDDQGRNEPLIFMPADRFKLTHQFHLPDAGRLWTENHLHLTTQMVARQDRFPEGIDYADPPAGYTLWHLDFDGQLSIAERPLNISFSVQNIFNSSYRDYLSRFRYYVDDPGRTIILRLQIPFGSH